MLAHLVHSSTQKDSLAKPLSSVATPEILDVNNQIELLTTSLTRTDQSLVNKIASSYLARVRETYSLQDDTLGFLLFDRGEALLALTQLLKTYNNKDLPIYAYSSNEDSLGSLLKVTPEVKCIRDIHHCKKNSGLIICIHPGIQKAATDRVLEVLDLAEEANISICIDVSGPACLTDLNNFVSEYFKTLVSHQAVIASHVDHSRATGILGVSSVFVQNNHENEAIQNVTKQMFNVGENLYFQSQNGYFGRTTLPVLPAYEFNQVNKLQTLNTTGTKVYKPTEVTFPGSITLQCSDLSQELYNNDQAEFGILGKVNAPEVLRSALSYRKTNLLERTTVTDLILKDYLNSYDTVLPTQNPSGRVICSSGSWAVHLAVRAGIAKSLIKRPHKKPVVVGSSLVHKSVKNVAQQYGEFRPVAVSSKTYQMSETQLIEELIGADVLVLNAVSIHTGIPEIVPKHILDYCYEHGIQVVIDRCASAPFEVLPDKKHLNPKLNTASLLKKLRQQINHPAVVARAEDLGKLLGPIGGHSVVTFTGSDTIDILRTQVPEVNFYKDSPMHYNVGHYACLSIPASYAKLTSDTLKYFSLDGIRWLSCHAHINAFILSDMLREQGYCVLPVASESIVIRKSQGARDPIDEPTLNSLGLSVSKVNQSHAFHDLVDNFEATRFFISPQTIYPPASFDFLLKRITYPGLLQPYRTALVLPLKVEIRSEELSKLTKFYNKVETTNQTSKPKKLKNTPAMETLALLYASRNVSSGVVHIYRALHFLQQYLDENRSAQKAELLSGFKTELSKFDIYSNRTEFNFGLPGKDPHFVKDLYLQKIVNRIKLLTPLLMLPSMKLKKFIGGLIEDMVSKKFAKHFSPDYYRNKLAPVPILPLEDTLKSN